MGATAGKLPEEALLQGQQQQQRSQVRSPSTVAFCLLTALLLLAAIGSSGRGDAPWLRLVVRLHTVGASVACAATPQQTVATGAAESCILVARQPPPKCLFYNDKQLAGPCNFDPARLACTFPEATRTTVAATPGCAAGAAAAAETGTRAAAASQEQRKQQRAQRGRSMLLPPVMPRRQPKLHVHPSTPGSWGPPTTAAAAAAGGWQPGTVFRPANTSSCPGPAVTGAAGLVGWARATGFRRLVMCGDSTMRQVRVHPGGGVGWVGWGACAPPAGCATGRAAPAHIGWPHGSAACPCPCLPCCALQLSMLSTQMSGRAPRQNTLAAAHLPSSPPLSPPARLPAVLSAGGDPGTRRAGHCGCGVSAVRPLRPGMGRRPARHAAGGWVGPSAAGATSTRTDHCACMPAGCTAPLSLRGGVQVKPHASAHPPCPPTHPPTHPTNHPVPFPPGGPSSPLFPRTPFGSPKTATRPACDQTAAPAAPRTRGWSPAVRRARRCRRAWPARSCRSAW